MASRPITMVTPIHQRRGMQGSGNINAGSVVAGVQSTDG